MNSIEVANTIREQLGHQALLMLGAKNLSSTGKGPNELGGLSFRIGNNAKGVTHIKISLHVSDTYKVEFIKQHRAPSYEVERLHVSEDIYVDQLHDLIERHTGMYTSLFPRTG